MKIFLRMLNQVHDQNDEIPKNLVMSMQSLQMSEGSSVMKVGSDSFGDPFIQKVLQN
mgnify:CR=1 FL=1